VRGSIEKLAVNLAKAGVNVERPKQAVAGLRRIEPALFSDAYVVPRRFLRGPISKQAAPALPESDTSSAAERLRGIGFAPPKMFDD